MRFTFKKLLSLALASTMIFSSIPTYADAITGAIKAYDAIWNHGGAAIAASKSDELKKKIEALKKQPETDETKHQIAELEKELSKVVDGTWEGVEGYKYAYFPTIYVNTVWQASDGKSCTIAGSPFNLGGTFSYNISDMNEYGLLDHMKSTLQIENEDIDQVILYNHNCGDTRNFPKGKVFPMQDHPGMAKAGASKAVVSGKDEVKINTGETVDAIDFFINTFDKQYRAVSTTKNKVTNYQWNDQTKNGSFTENMTLNTPDGSTKGFQLTKDYFSAIQKAKNNGTLTASLKQSEATKFRQSVANYGLPDDVVEKIINNVNTGSISTSGNVQAYCFYTLQVWVVGYNGGGGDLYPPSLTLSADGKYVTGPKVGEEHCITVEVKNNNLVPIGADPANGNDKIYPLIHVIDNLTGKDIFKKTVKADANIPSGGTTKVKVCGVKIDTPEIKVCTNVDSDGHYNKLGLNDNVTNDTLCKVFKSVQDMGMSQTMTLDGPNGPNVLLPGATHSITVFPKHVVGDIAVGLDDINNPKATVDLTAETISGNKFYTNTLKAKDILYPSKAVPVKFDNIKVPAEVPQIKVCATVNKIHDEKHFNLRNGNDTYCQIFSTIRNFAIKNLRLSPTLVYSDKAITKNINFSFTVANEAPKSEFTPAPTVVIRQGGNVIWSKVIGIKDGDNIEVSQTLSVKLQPGNNTFEVEVNPDRSIVEYRPDGNPYIDNKKVATVAVQKLEKDIACTKENSSNEWKQKFFVHIQKGIPYEYQVCSSHDSKGNCTGHRTVKACKDLVVKEDSKTINFYENYNIKNVLFRSKYTKDHDKSGDGWVDLMNGGSAVIKSGYGFELAALVTYKTNRYKDYEAYRTSFSPVPPFYENRCTYGTISPQVSAANQPETIALKLPFANTSSGSYHLQVTQASGSWDDSAYLFELPLRKNLSGSGDVRMIYTNEHAAVGIKTFSYTTPIWPGYQESGVKKKMLQQCYTGTIKIIANDDLHGHLTN